MPVGNRVRSALNLEALVEHMFDQVLSAPEREELLVWIRRWEAAHPDADAAHRVTGWIDVAYEFQARSHPSRAGLEPVREPVWSLGNLALA